jgi:hypothetical protein
MKPSSQALQFRLYTKLYCAVVAWDLCHPVAKVKNIAPCLQLGGLDG